MVFSFADDGRTTLSVLFQQEEGTSPGNSPRNCYRMDGEAMREAAGFSDDGA